MINDVLPIEVLGSIFSQLDSPTRLSAMLTCKSWLSMLSSEVPTIKHLHVDLDSLSCNGRIVWVFHENFFQNLLIADIADTKSMTLSGEIVNDYVMLVILRECSNYLRSLQFNLVDMGSVKLWTLAILARFCALQAVHFDSCRFPDDVNESFLLRILAPSFPTLETICVTNSTLITDKFALTVAKKCPNLKEFNVSGCSEVTALSVVAFSEALVFNKDAHPINLDLRNTSFKSIELSRHLCNPLLQCGPCWRPQAVTLTIGFDRPAIVLENTEKHDLVIVVYV